MRYSKQREIIYNYVMSHCNHPTASEIYQNLKKDNPKLSLGTVYRNLSVLSEKNLIKRVEVSSSFDRFDKTLENHSHLLCIKCDMVFDVMDEVSDTIKNIYNFDVISYNSLFKGICEKCQQRKEGEK